MKYNLLKTIIFSSFSLFCITSCVKEKVINTDFDKHPQSVYYTKNGNPVLAIGYETNGFLISSPSGISFSHSPHNWSISGTIIQSESKYASYKESVVFYFDSTQFHTGKINLTNTNFSYSVSNADQNSTTGTIDSTNAAWINIITLDTACKSVKANFSCDIWHNQERISIRNGIIQSNYCKK